MRSARLRAICGHDLRHNARRPLSWIWLLLALLSSTLLSAGILRIRSGEVTAGGIEVHITSEFANAYELPLAMAVLFAFFVAIAAGMGVIRDRELRVEPMLHATPLRPSEYVWGKFGATMVTTACVLAVQLVLIVFFKHVLTAGSRPELIGAFSLRAYLLPTFVLAVPLLVFVGGVSFAMGERTRRPILVSLVPLVLLLASMFFLWSWSPSWLDPRWNRVLMLIDPTGFRWLNESWLTVDRGADFYNTEAVVYDLPFLLSRVALFAIGLLAVALSPGHLERSLRGRRVGPRLATRALTDLAAAPATTVVKRTPLATLGMTSRRPGLVPSTLEVLRTESSWLMGHPALWLFVPLVVLNCTVDAIYAVGAFDTPLLLTPGASAVGSLVELTFTLCMLLMFFTVEALRRETTTGTAAITYSTPVRTSALVLGKVLASSLVGVITLLAVVATCLVLLVLQGTVPVTVGPYGIVFGLLIGPVVLVWCSFVALVFALTQNRYATWGIALAVMTAMGILSISGRMTWVWNWSLSGALLWSDMGLFELNRTPLILNRLLALAAAVLFLALAVRVFPRRAFDSMGITERLSPGALGRFALRLAPFVLPVLILGFWLQRGIDAGPDGSRARRWAKDYWRRNHATWLDAPLPDLVRSDIELELEPERRWLHTRGQYVLTNATAAPLEAIPVTGGPHWEQVSWTLDGAEYRPEQRAGLYVFRPPQPLLPDEGCTIGFELEGVLLGGFTRNGGGASEFILPSGVVLTTVYPSFVPVIGYLEGVGLDDDNRYDSRDWPDDFHEGFTRAITGPAVPHKVRIRITAPEEYSMNSVGVLTESSVAQGRRTVTWESDFPIDYFNVVGGRWEVREGQGTAIFYHPEHGYNIDTMLLALDAARRHYSEWFYPFPWQELKLSEFPALASYAQGFPTNITFSEGIGFLAEAEPEVDAPFFVTAHEAAHQWWGGLLMPGEGPGGNLLSEGTSHFSTILLFGEVRGEDARIKLCRRLEDEYCAGRRVDVERPLVKIDGSRAGDKVVTYDKAGWVFWMLLNHLGRENGLAAIRSFIAHYVEDRDNPVLQDLVAHLRPFASDLEAYDAFVQQWFFEVVLPEYELEAPELVDLGDAWEVRLTLRNVGTGRMPVEVALQGAEPFAEARVLALVGPDEDRPVTIRCDFEPERVVVDPDALVLQNDRRGAVHELRRD